MNFLIPILYFLLVTGTLVVFFKKKFAICLPIAMMLSAFSLYFSQFIFKTFNVGIIFNIVLALLFPTLLFINKLRNKSFKTIKENYFSTGLVVFILIFIIFYVFNLNRTFANWDEWSHWGVMVKEMLRLDKFYTVDASTLMVHKDYPPIIQLFELFFCKISGGYSESNLIKSLHILNFSFFVPIISMVKIDKKNLLKSLLKILLLIFIFYFIILSFDMHGIINSIYIDYTMAIIFVYSIYLIFSNKTTIDNFTLFNLSLTISFMLLVKQMSLALFLLVLFLFIIDLILKSKDKLKNIIKKLFTKKNIVVFIKIFVLLVIVPLFIWKLWGIYITLLNVEQQFSLSDIEIFKLPSIIFGNYGESFQRITFNNFKSSLINYNIGTTILKMNYILSFIATGIIILYFAKKNNNYLQKKDCYAIGCTLLIGYIGYAFTMLLLYVFAFGDYEGPVLASYDRYMSTYVMAVALIIFTIYLIQSTNKFNDKDFLKKLLIIFIMLILIQIPSKLKKIIPTINKSEANVFENYAQVVKEKTPENSKVFVITQNENSSYSYFIKYYSENRLFNLKYYSLPSGEKFSFDEKNNALNEIKKYDYLYLIKINDIIKSEYTELFNENSKEGQIYKINKDGNNISLQLVN